MFNVYTCSDYHLDIKERELIIWDPELVGIVKCEMGFKDLISRTQYNNICCPGLMPCDLIIIKYTKDKSN